MVLLCFSACVKGEASAEPPPCKFLACIGIDLVAGLANDGGDDDHDDEREGKGRGGEIKHR